MVCSPKDFCHRLRRCRGLFAVIVLVCSLTGPVQAQVGNFEDLLESKFSKNPSAKASFNATLAPATAKPGDEVTLTVTAQLPPHSYIYATTGDFEARISHYDHKVGRPRTE